MISVVLTACTRPSTASYVSSATLTGLLIATFLALATTDPFVEKRSRSSAVVFPVIVPPPRHHAKPASIAVVLFSELVGRTIVVVE